MVNPVCTEVSTLGDLLIRSTKSFPDRDILVMPNERVTYQTVQAQAFDLARGLLAMGVERGDHVGLFMSNGAPFVEALFAVTLLGCVVVPLNTRHRASELSYIIGHADLKVLITSGIDRAYIDLPALLLEALSLPDDSDGEVWSEAAPRLCHLIDCDPNCRPPFISLAQVVEWGGGVASAAVEARRRAVRVRDPAIILYTSGTTAHPKGCMLSHEALTRGPVERARYRLSSGSRDVTWAAGPLFHIGSLAPFVGSVGVGGTFLADQYFEAGRALALMRREGVTLAWPWFSAIVQGLIDHPTFTGADFPRLRFVFLIAPEAVASRVQALLPRSEILQACGMTETGGIFALTGPDESVASRSATQGQAAPGVEIRIVDPQTGADLPDNVTGEIWVRGYCVMDGYYRSPDLTAAALGRDGWLRTGDLYTRSGEHSYVFRGRLKDMLKVGGENVATMEVEGFLCSHPDVKLAEVVGKADARLDEVPVAFIELRDGARVTALDIIEFCKGRIASYKVPREVRFVRPEDWPMSATKVDKRALRDLLRG